MTADPPKPKPFNFAIPFIVVSGLLGIGGFLLLRGTARSGVIERRGYSAKNLKEMGDLIKSAGYPDDPNALLADRPGLAINPSWPEQVGYVYISKVKATDAADTMVLFENVPPEKRKIGRQVLLQSGNVELIPEDAFQTRLKELEARWSTEHRPWQLVPVGKDRTEDGLSSM